MRPVRGSVLGFVLGFVPERDAFWMSAEPLERLAPSPGYQPGYRVELG
ncbi:MAG: hypothetical protein AAF922_19180 [Pseudomonadota bacterium]